MYDTITAIATPKGESAIGVIRLSGEDSLKIADKVFRSSSNKPLSHYDSRRMTYGSIYEGDKKIDEVMVVYLKGPKTYTREDIVEINCHGSYVSMNNILSLLLENGARIAEKGEFTQRAFLNGRLDLSQAESIMDMISSKTNIGFDNAMNQLDGFLSRKISELRADLTGLLANLQVSIDYPEEDIEEITFSQVESVLGNSLIKVDKLLESSNGGKIIRDGLNTVIIGKPNVGKSSLLNALIKENRAIVTDIPGTTRDVIEEFINIKGIPVKIIDTAGIRETENMIEKIGIEKSKEFFNKSDLVILVLNSSEKLSKDDLDLLKVVRDKKVIVIINKIDLEKQIEEEIIMDLLPNAKIIGTSIMNDIGLNLVENSIHDLVLLGISANESEFVTNIRHIDSLKKAKQSLKDALKGANQRIAYDFIEVDIKNSFEYLGEIIGETIDDDVIKAIFSKFCLGK